MIGDDIKQISGVISPGVPGQTLLEAWQNRPEADFAPETTVVTDGRTFTITYRSTWQDGMLKHAFQMVVQQVANLEADRNGHPKVEALIEWQQ